MIDWVQSSLFPGVLPPASSVAEFLESNHYLGAVTRGEAWVDDNGAIVVSAPTSRMLPCHWIDLVRWCLVPGSTGSAQWSAFAKWLVKWRQSTTVVSYSDPGEGHTGALYRAAGWLWAPTWHRLRPPPSKNGRWRPGGAVQGVKDRWVFPLRPDEDREAVLAIKDRALLKRFPWASYREPKWKRGRRTGGGADYSRLAELERVG